MDRILISLKKENGPRASSAPALGLNTIIFKHVYWYMQQTQVSVYRTIGPLVFSKLINTDRVIGSVTLHIKTFHETFHIVSLVLNILNIKKLYATRALLCEPVRMCLICAGLSKCLTIMTILCL